jgi:uncharacterized membrane protein required for colicin V production
LQNIRPAPHNSAMGWIFDVIAILALIASFIGGLKDGAVKTFFSLLALIIAIPLAGLSYHLLATVLSFLPGTNWENFLGFFITMVIIGIILHLIFLLPRKLIRKIWEKGCLFRLLGGVLNVFGTGIGLTVFAPVLRTYPIFDWLERWVINSGVMMWLVDKFGFVQSMLPEIFRQIATSV